MRDRVLRQRLAVQRLTATPFGDPVDAVRLLTCVQAQDAPLARFSIGLRTADAADDDVRRAIDTAQIVRTHILRPTWHYVAAEDLRWILELTSAKVESSMAARHRALDLSPARIDVALTQLATLLGDRRYLVRAEIAAELRARGTADANDQVGHLLLLAELRGLICSGPLRGAQHTYALVDDIIAPTSPRARDEAVRELVARFFAGHGPAAITDLTRWTKLTQGEIKAALADLDDRLDHMDVDGTTLWFDPAPAPTAQRAPRAFLLPTFDEAFLTYPHLNFPRANGHPRGGQPHSFGEAGGGVVICDRRDVGWWKRSAPAGRAHIDITVAVAAGLDLDERDHVAMAADRLARFVGRAATVPDR